MICLEVLEHLENPAEWLKKLCASGAGHIILSVPHEPWFRLCQMLSLRNLSRWGNDADHVQNWSARRFRHFVEEHLDITRLELAAFPFILLAGTPKSRRGS